MEKQKFYAYRSYGDRAGTGEMTMDSDPNTGQYPYLHAAGDVVVFGSEEERDMYVAQGVVATHVGGGRDRKWHWVSAVTAEEGLDHLERCGARPMCIHKDQAQRGRVRIAE